MHRNKTTKRIILAAAAALLALPTVASAQMGPPQVDPEVKRQRMAQLFQIIKREPSITQVQRYAVENYELETDRINGMKQSPGLSTPRAYARRTPATRA